MWKQRILEVLFMNVEAEDLEVLFMNVEAGDPRSTLHECGSSRSQKQYS
jgi:hypothetical protein